MTAQHNNRGDQRGQRALLRSLALPVYLPALLNAICLNAITILLPLYVYELSGSASIAAMTVGLRGLGTMLSGIPASLLVSRLGDKAVILIGVGLMALTMVGLTFAPSVSWLTALSFGFGFFLGTWQLARLHYITRELPNEQRGRGIAFMAGLTRAGALIGPAAGGALAHWSSYATVFLVLAVLYSCSAVLIIRFASAGRRQYPSTPAHRRLWQVWQTHRSVFVCAGPVMIVLQLMRAARTLVIPLWGTHIGLSASDIGLIFSLSAALDMVMFYPAGLIIDTYGRRYAVIPGLFFMASAVLVLPLANSLFGFTLVNLLAALGNGFSTGIAMTLGGDFAPPEQRGEFLGLWRQIGDIGTAMGPFGIGWVITLSGIASASMVVGLTGLAGIGIAYFFLPETLKRSQSKSNR